MGGRDRRTRWWGRGPSPPTTTSGFRHRWLWPATVVAELTVLAQVGLGVALVAIQDREVADFHALYGFAAFASVGILYSYRNQMQDRLHLLYGLGGLWLMGLAIRAMTISPFAVGVA